MFVIQRQVFRFQYSLAEPDIQFVKVVFAMRLEFRLILLTNIHDPIVLHKVNS